MNQRPVNFIRSNKDLIAVVCLSLLVIGIYYQTTGFGFINLDDNLYVYDNQAVAQGLNFETIKWAFTTFWSANWHPLTWLTHALDVQLFGLNPGMHHVVNVLFHLVNSILAFVVFRRMTGREWESLIVAALFAVHPTHVESVAWVSERKDVLSTMFWLLTMLAYARFCSVEQTGNRWERLTSSSYLLVVILFALGLLSKPMLVTLPLVLLLCDYWPLGRMKTKRDILPRIVEKTPLLALSVGSSVMTFLAQRSVGAVESLDYLPFSTRVVNAFVAYTKYIFMLFYPADLAVYYPYSKNLWTWQAAVSVLTLAAISALCVWQYKRRPFLIVGWLWFLGTLVPVIGIVQVGSQSLADRYTYIPYFGLFIMLVWGARSVLREGGFSVRAFAGVSVVGVLALTAFAYRQAGYWRDNETLYRHTLAVTTGNYVIAHNLCHSFLLQDRLDEGEPLCLQAVEEKPDYGESYNTLGVIYFKRGDFAKAEALFKRSLELQPGTAYPLLNLAQAQSRQLKAEEAEETLRRAVEASGGAVNNVFAGPLSDIAAAFAAQQNYEKSAENLRRFIFLQPTNADARARLALTLYFLKEFDQADAEAQNALVLKQNSAEAWNTVGLVALARNDNARAETAFQQVVTIAPDFPEAKANLEKAKAGAKAN